jgi:site-specific DNA recombinase
MQHVLAYIRVSTARQGIQGSSLQEQQAAIAAYAEHQALHISEWFEERETAAKRGRPVFARMLKLLERGRATGVIIHKIDRSARNLKDWADLGELIDRGIQVHFAHESLDLQSRGGRLAADIQAVVAADYIRNLKDEVRKGFRGRFRQGLYPLAAPIGYLDQGSGQAKIPDPVMAPLVKQVFALYASGRYNILQLGDEAHRLGLRNKRGGRVTRNGLSTLLNNPFYIGIIRVRRSGEQFPGVHAPLVSPTLFEAVRAQLQGRTVHRSLKHDYRYRKLIACASCGYRLSGERQKGHIYYRCHTPSCPSTCVREEEIEQQARCALAKVAPSREDITAIADELGQILRSRGDQTAEHIRNAQLRLDQINDRLARLADALVDGLIEKQIYLTKNAKLLRERVDADEVLRQLRAGADPIRSRVRDYFELLKKLCEAQNDDFGGNPRDILQSATSNLRLNRKKLLVEWKTTFLPLVERQKDQSGGPHRAAPRTDGKMMSRAGSHKRSLSKEKIKQLVEKIYHELEHDGEGMAGRR